MDDLLPHTFFIHNAAGTIPKEFLIIGKGYNLMDEIVHSSPFANQNCSQFGKLGRYPPPRLPPSPHSFQFLPLTMRGYRHTLGSPARLFCCVFFCCRFCAFSRSVGLSFFLSFLLSSSSSKLSRRKNVLERERESGRASERSPGLSHRILQQSSKSSFSTIINHPAPTGSECFTTSLDEVPVASSCFSTTYFG
jgi:hypothetical protein